MLQGWWFSLCLIIYLQQRYWECGIREALPPPPPPCIITMDYSTKKKNRVGVVGGWGHTFLKNPWNFQVFALPLNSKLNKPSPERLQKIVLHHTELLRTKTKTTGYSTWFFLDHPWRFLVAFNQHPENPLAISLITL